MTDPVPQVSPADAVGLVSAGATLIDVREDDEWSAGHAPGALHAPMSRFAAHVPSLPRSGALVIVCRSGRRSDQVASVLRQGGLDAYNLAGGMQDWQRGGGAVVTPAGTPGTVI
jgi:rhodanese-related sulfurtransferase